jgi:response regulator RpfG family c-di-GMP phosphodiesterase
MSNRTPESSRVDEQTLKYAEEFSVLYANERSERQRAEDALATLEASYATTVRALAAALELRDDATGRHAERVTALALALT